MHSSSHATTPNNVTNGEAKNTRVTDLSCNDQKQNHATFPSRPSQNQLQDLLQQSFRLYSLCFQQYVNMDFYQHLLTKLFKKAKVFDEATEDTRSTVWRDVYNLLGMTPQDVTSPFLPLILEWIQQGEVNLFALEILYVAFMKSASFATENASQLSSSNNCLPANHSSQTETETTQQLLDATTPWGCNVPSVLYQLRLLLHWEARLEKLSGCSKKAIWSTCKSLRCFSNYDETSIKRTLETWASNPLLNLSNITTFYSAIGFLKNSGNLKGDFCFPKTTVPVFVSEKDNFTYSEFSRQYPVQPSFLRQVSSSQPVQESNNTPSRTFSSSNNNNNNNNNNNTHTNNSNNNFPPMRTDTNTTKHTNPSVESPVVFRSSFPVESKLQREMDEINMFLSNGANLESVLTSHKQILPTLPIPQASQFYSYQSNNNPILPSLDSFSFHSRSENASVEPLLPPLTSSFHLPFMSDYSSTLFPQASHSYPGSIYPLPPLKESEEAFSRKRKEREDKQQPQPTPDKPDKPRRRNSLVGLRRNSVSSLENMDSPSARRNSFVNAAQDLLIFSQNVVRNAGEVSEEPPQCRTTEDNLQQLPPSKRRRSLVFEAETNVKKMSISSLLCNPPC